MEVKSCRYPAQHQLPARRATYPQLHHDQGHDRPSPAEGQINRLKMLKRTMYGRAGFELLRARVLFVS